MRVLVTHGSKHGGTAEIAARIASVIEEAGHTVTLVPAKEVTAIDADAVVLGGAVYAGNWTRAAAAFVDRFAADLADKRVWAFSSGPLGDPPVPVEVPAAAQKLADRIGAQEHQIFAGSLDRSQLSLGEKAVIAMVKAPDGDYRDWPAIEAWAQEIAAALDGKDSSEKSGD